MLAGAGDECLCLARSDFLAWVRSMAGIRTAVFTDCLLPATRLSARRGGIFALSRPVARFLTEMNPAFQFLATRQATGNGRKPAWLVLERLLSASTRLFHQVRTGRTWHGVFVALMLDLLVAACWAACTIVVTWWRSSTARLRRMQNSSSTSTSNFLEYSFETAGTGPFVTERWTGVVPTLQWATTNSDTDVLRLHVLLCCHAAVLTFCGLAFTGLFLSWTTPLSTFVSTAIQSSTADPSARWRFLHTLVTHTV
jgi:hypothetical protein